jgi:hypothetical protein
VSQESLVTFEGVVLEWCPTSDTHLRGIPVITPVKRRTMVTRRGKAASRRPNSRVRVSNPGAAREAFLDDLYAV